MIVKKTGLIEEYKCFVADNAKVLGYKYNQIKHTEHCSTNYPGFKKIK